MKEDVLQSEGLGREDSQEENLRGEDTQIESLQIEELQRELVGGRRATGTLFFPPKKN